MRGASSGSMRWERSDDDGRPGGLPRSRAAGGADEMIDALPVRRGSLRGRPWEETVEALDRCPEQGLEGRRASGAPRRVEPELDLHAHSGGLGKAVADRGCTHCGLPSVAVTRCRRAEDLDPEAVAPGRARRAPTIGWVRGWWRCDDVPLVAIAVDLQRIRVVVPEPGKVGAQDRVDLVLEPVELDRARGVACGVPDLLPPVVAAQLQVVQTFEQIEEPGELDGAALEGAALVLEGPAQLEETDHRGVRVDLDGAGGVDASSVSGVGLPAVALRERPGTGRVEVGHREVARVAAGLVDAVSTRDEALAGPHTGRVGHDERRVDRHVDDTAEVGQPAVDLGVGDGARRTEQRSAAVDSGEPGTGTGAPGEVDTDVHGHRPSRSVVTKKHSIVITRP